MKLLSMALLASLALASTAVVADEKSAQTSVTTKAVGLSDAELDQITAGAVLTVLIAPPSNAFHFGQHGDVTVLILGTGKGNDIFGSIVLANKHGAKIITIPGGR